MPTREGTPKKKRGAQDFVWMLAILGVIFAVILGRQEYKIYQINKEAEATRLRVEQLQRVQADLEAERKRLYDPKYIEKLAREDHNYVKKDEVPIFIVKDKDKTQEEKQRQKKRTAKPKRTQLKRTDRFKRACLQRTAQAERSQVIEPFKLTLFLPRWYNNSVLF